MSWQRALAAHRAGKLDEAASLYLNFLRDHPDHAGALNNLGIVRRRRGDLGEAERLFRTALKAQPDFVEAHLNLGHVRSDLANAPDAIAAYRAAIALRPDLPQANLDLGIQLSRRGDFLEAGQSFARAAALEPSLHYAHLGRGRVFARFRQFDLALTCLERTIDLAPADASILVERCGYLERLGRYGEAIAGYRRANTIDPKSPAVRAAWLGAKQRACDWADLPELETAVLADLERELNAGVRTTLTPLAHCRLIDAPEQRLRIASAYARHLSAGLAPLAPRQPAREAPRSKLRVGYLSCGFGNHPVGHMIAGILRAHDRTRFEVAAYGYGGLGARHMRESLAGLCERFVDLTTLDDDAAAWRVRQDGIDILVDLHAWADASRPAILALRPTPIQISWLGYPGSFGAPFSDYSIVDHVAVPSGEEAHWAEKLMYLPHAYLPGDGARATAIPRSCRVDQGLPEGAVVLASFNQPFKISREIWAIWMRILRALPNSVLWLLEGHRESRRNLRGEARRHGIDAARLVFARRLGRQNHLKRLGLADLALDTFPYTGGVTTLDMMLAGVPVITCAGRSLAARHSASLLAGVGLDELITHDLAAYSALATALARDAEARGRLRARADIARRTATQFNPDGFARNLERAYEQAWARAAQGQMSQSFEV